MKTLHNLIKPHGEWAARNFDTHLPAYGVGEEIGELTHSILKLRQGIRGKPEEHKAAIADALCDALLFLAHVAYMNKLERLDVSDEWPQLGWAEEASEQVLLARLFVWTGKLMEAAEVAPDLVSIYSLHVISILVHFALRYGVDLERELPRVAAEVHARDFRKYPLTGLAPNPFTRRLTL